jgi:hypothetical protein
MNSEEMLVAGLLCVYVPWLGVELQIFGAKSGYELGVLEGRTRETTTTSIISMRGSEAFRIEHVQI